MKNVWHKRFSEYKFETPAQCTPDELASDLSCWDTQSLSYCPKNYRYGSLTLLESFYIASRGILKIISTAPSMHSCQHKCEWTLHIPHGIPLQLLQIYINILTELTRVFISSLQQEKCHRQCVLNFFDFLDLSPFLGIFDFRKTPRTRIPGRTVGLFPIHVQHW